MSERTFQQAWHAIDFKTDKSLEHLLTLVHPLELKAMRGFDVITIADSVDELNNVSFKVPGKAEHRILQFHPPQMWVKLTPQSSTKPNLYVLIPGSTPFIKTHERPEYLPLPIGEEPNWRRGPTGVLSPTGGLACAPVP